MKFFFNLSILFILNSLWGNSYENLGYEPLGEGIWIQRNNHFYPNKIAIATVIISGEKQDYWAQCNTLCYQDIVAFGTKSKEIYARKYGYDFIIATQKLEDCYGIKPSRDLECAWTKIALISRILDSYDWVFWSDADSIILNFDIPLEDFIDEEFDVIACSQSHHEPKPYSLKQQINTGQVLYKNCEFTKNLIFEAWCNHDKKMQGYEQSRINALLKSPERGNHVLVCSERAFNLTPQRYQEGAFLVHMYGYYCGDLHQCFQKFEENYGWLLKKEEDKYEQ